MKKWILFLAASAISFSLSGCTDSSRSGAIPESHPAFGFYQIAKAGRTTSEACRSYGGQEFYPNDYEMLENLEQGLFTLRQRSTGNEYLGVSFAEGGAILTFKTCCWKTDI